MGRRPAAAGPVALVAGTLFIVTLSLAPRGVGAMSRLGQTSGMPSMAGMMAMSGMAGMAGMPGMHGGAATDAAPIAGAVEVRVEASNFAFAPSEIRLPRDVGVNLTLVNPAATGAEHDLTVPGLGIRVVVAAGTARTVGITSAPAGRYAAYCAVPGHADLGMRAMLIVE